MIKLSDRDIGIEKLFSLILHWNIILGICEILSRLPYLAFFGLVPKYSTYFAIFFVIATIYMMASMNSIKLAYTIPLIWIPLIILSVILEPRLEIILPRATIYYFLNIVCVVILFSYIKEYDILIKQLEKYVRIAVFYAIIHLLINEDGYSMFFSSAVAIPSLYCLAKAILGQKRQKLYYIPFAIFFIANLQGGSRGSILLYIILVALELLLFSGNSKRIKFTVVILVLGGIMIACWDRILSGLAILFPDSRNIRLLTNGLALYDAGRIDYYNELISTIMSNPFEFRGLYADRLLIANYSSDLDVLWGSYAHNIVIEVIYQLGILGILFVIILFVQIFKTISFSKKHMDDASNVVVSVILAYSIGQLLISSSYLIAPSFGALIGLLLNVRSRAKKYFSKTSNL